MDNATQEDTPVQLTLESSGSGRKRYCCGAAKRLKDKCLRFHQDEEKCREVIQGHVECVAVKRRFEGREQQLL